MSGQFLDGPRRRAQSRPEFREAVLHVRWCSDELLADDDAIAFQVPQGVREDLGGHPGDQGPQPGEPQR